jgi:hypothetical protein
MRALARWAHEPASASLHPGPLPDRAIDWARVREDFPLLTREVHGKPLIYLDSANTGQKPASVIEASTTSIAATTPTSAAPCTRWAPKPPRPTKARAQAGRASSTCARRLVLCSGTTFAINLVAYSWALPRLKAGDTILVSRMEHHANIVPWQLVAQRTGATIKVAEILPDGSLDLDALHAAMTADVKLLAIATRQQRAGHGQSGARDLPRGAQARHRHRGRRLAGRAAPAVDVPRSAAISTPSPATRCAARPAPARCGRAANTCRRCRPSSAAAR